MRTRFKAKYRKQTEQWGVYDYWALAWVSHHRTEFLAQRSAKRFERNFLDAIAWYYQRTSE